MSKLTEKTWVPLGLAVTAIGGGAAWLTIMYVNQSALADQVKALQVKQEALGALQTDIAVMRQQLSAINEKVDRVEQKIDRIR